MIITFPPKEPLLLRNLLVLVLLTICVFALAAQEDDTDGQKVMELPVHTLGDQSLAISAGLCIPLFFQEFVGPDPYHATNLTVGATGSLQWSAYLNPFIRLGLEISGAFAFSPNARALIMLPITIEGSYVFQVSRFEFPLSLGAGICIVRYREWSHLDIILKPGAAAYWRYDANWSFGANLAWWLDFQPVTENQSPNQARMGHFLEFTPSVFYHF